MDSKVEELDEIKQVARSMLDGIEFDCEMLSKNGKEPSEGTTTDKSGIIDTKSNEIHLEPKESIDSAQNEARQEDGDELIENKCVEVKQEPNNDGLNGDIKQDNQEVEEDEEEDDEDDEEEEEEEEEEVEDKEEDEVDKMKIEKPTKDPDNQDGSQLDDKLSYLGRNRRVRQKNRYFLDFHCIDLTKGARSNRDDFDAFATNTNTRSSNRRSTTDSIRGQQDETEVFETRYCRKCSSKTPHDFDGGCQACLYKKIVESSKRQKPSGQRNRSATTKQQQQQHDNELETATSSATPALASNKRKSNKQGGSKNKYVNQRYRSIVDLRRNCNINNNDNNNGNNDNNIVNPAPQPQAAPASGDTTIVSATNTTIIEGCSSSTSSNSTSSSTNINTNNHNNINNNINNSKLPKLDSWTPDEVADYILSKGFANEAELFKTQSVDGISLLLMQRTDFTYGLKIKLGPALKIYDQVCKLKREYFKTVTVSQQ